MSNLPVHPLLRHPRTGLPLTAVGIVNGRVIWPILGGAENGGQGGEGGQQGAGQQNGGQGGSGQGNGGPQGQQGNGGQSGTDNDRGYPASTPLAEMTTDQQLAYHRYHSRQWQQRYEGLGLPQGQEAATIAELREAKRLRDEAEAANMSEVDRLKAENSTLAERVAANERQQARIAAAKAAELPSEWHEDVTGDTPEAAKASAERIAAKLAVTARGGTQQGNGGGGYQGYRGGGGSQTGTVAAGRERYAERNKKTTNT